MSEQDVEIVRRIYAEWEQGNFFVLPELFDPDIHVIWVDPLLAPEGETRGLDELLGTMHTFLEQWEKVWAVPQEILDAGEAVLCLAVWHARGRGSGVPIEHPQANLWTLVDGRATRLVNYGDPEEGLEAAGLSE